MSNLALHIPIPSFSNGSLKLYGNTVRIEKKVRDCLKYFETLTGNMIIGGPLGSVYRFNCDICSTEIGRPEDSLKQLTLVNCINPECSESYSIEPDNAEGYKITRQTRAFECSECKEQLTVPVNQLLHMTLRHTLTLQCYRCRGTTEVVLRPFGKYESEKDT